MVLFRTTAAKCPFQENWWFIGPSEDHSNLPRPINKLNVFKYPKTKNITPPHTKQMTPKHKKQNEWVSEKIWSKKYNNIYLNLKKLFEIFEKKKNFEKKRKCERKKWKRLWQFWKDFELLPQVKGVNIRLVWSGLMIVTPKINQSIWGGLEYCFSLVGLSLQLVMVWYGLSVRGLQLVLVASGLVMDQNMSGQGH